MNKINNKQNILYNNKTLSIFIVFLLVLYIFNIIPNIGFEKLGTREYLSILSCFFVFPRYSDNRLYKGIIFANWTQVLFSVLAAIGNGTTDFWYVQFALRNILYINGALLIVNLLPKGFKLEDFLLLILCAIIINSVIASVCFIMPSAMQFLLSIQHFSDIDKIDNTVRFGVRMIGLGCGNFYVGGIINGFGIIITFMLILRKKFNMIIGSAIILFLFFVGVFIARTTIIGTGAGLLYYIILEKKTKSIPFVVIVVSLTILIFTLGLFSNIDTSHAFEFFTTDTDDVTSARTIVSLSHMYNLNIEPTTWILGDGLSKENGLYYKQTDVGILRNILYFGLLGTIGGYFYYEVYLLKRISRMYLELKYIGSLLFLYLVVLNFKGLPDYNFMLFLFLAYGLHKQSHFMKK